MKTKLFMVGLAALALSACAGAPPTLEDKGGITAAEWRNAPSTALTRVYVDRKSASVVTATVINVPSDARVGWGTFLASSAASLIELCPLTWETTKSFTTAGPPAVSKVGDLVRPKGLSVVTRQTFSDGTSGAVIVHFDDGDEGRGYVACGRWSTETDDTMFSDFETITEHLSVSSE
jgi:hypothetical protein